MDNISSRMARPVEWQVSRRAEERRHMEVSSYLEGSSAKENGGGLCRAKTYNGYYDTYVQRMAVKLIEGKDRCAAVHPFEEGWIGGNWRRVDGCGGFPMVSEDAPMLIKKYGHFIFAFNDEYLLLGVPGSRSEEERPDRGASGFTVWQPIKDSEIYGYWLLMIERKTGRIAEIS